MRVIRLSRKKKKNDDKVRYKLKLYDDSTYNIFFDFNIESRILKLAYNDLRRKYNLQGDIPDNWVVDKNFYKPIYKILRRRINNIEKQIKKRYPKFYFMTTVIDEDNPPVFQRIDDDTYNVTVTIRGDYTGIRSTTTD